MRFGFIGKAMFPKFISQGKNLGESSGQKKFDERENVFFSLVSRKDNQKNNAGKEGSSSKLSLF